MRTKTKTKTWEVMRRTARRILPVAVLALGASLSVTTANVSAESKAWGPERPTYEWAHPADHVTFNSITDNIRIGDERNFVRIRKAGTTDTLGDEVELEVGEEYEVSIWYHNNAATIYNAEKYDYKGVAKNVRLRIEQPEKVAANTNAIIKGIISADNADPKEVWDIAYAHTTSAVYLRYVPNSAVIHSLGTIDGQILDSNAMFGEKGVMLGYWNDAWGTLPGCNEYSGYVTYRFKVDKPDFEIKKKVSKEKENNYKSELEVEPGAVLDFKIEYTNTGTMNQMQIMAYDQMPEGLKYIEGTSFFRSNTNEEGNFISDRLFNGGANLGDYRPGDSFVLTYKVEVTKDKEFFPCDKKIELFNNASVATADGTAYDKVKIIVKRTCIPHTGPTEFVLASVVVTALGVGAAYYVASRRQLKKITESTEK
jgi:uncharacterized repeat protein (TIGR01451 family)